MNQAEQRAAVRQGCGCLLLFVATVAALALAGTGFRRLSTFGDKGEIVIGNFEELAGALLWLGPVTLILLVAALCARSWIRVGLGVALVLGLSAASFHHFVYDGFCAVRTRGGQVELAYP